MINIYLNLKYYVLNSYKYENQTHSKGVSKSSDSTRLFRTWEFVFFSTMVVDIIFVRTDSFEK